jgi:very-short-patch-repair endonuclease
LRGKDQESNKRARSMRRAPTDAEFRLWSCLRGRQLGGLKFDRYSVDFVCRERRPIVEVDGGQHANSLDDKRRDRAPSPLGYRVIRFWNNDALHNARGVLRRPLSELEVAPLTPVLSPQAGRGR